MKKLLLGFLSLLAVISVTSAFATVTPHFHSYRMSIAEALSKKTTATDSGTISVINFDIYDSMNAFFTINSPCDTPFVGNGPAPGQLLPRSATGVDIQPAAPDMICLNDTTSGVQFFAQTVTPPVMVTAFADGGTWQVNVTPIS